MQKKMIFFSIFFFDFLKKIRFFFEFFLTFLIFFEF